MHPDLTAEYLASQGLNESFPKRFWAKVQKTEGCWLWTASTANAGYPTIRRGNPFRGNLPGPRAAWILQRGPIPEGLEVCHDCPDGDKAACVKGTHLWLGTHAENMADAVKKGRSTRILTADEAIEIRRRYSVGGIGQRQLAAIFGVTKRTIWYILHGITFKDCL